MFLKAKDIGLKAIIYLPGFIRLHTREKSPNSHGPMLKIGKMRGKTAIKYGKVVVAIHNYRPTLTEKLYPNQIQLDLMFFVHLNASQQNTLEVHIFWLLIYIVYGNCITALGF